MEYKQYVTSCHHPLWQITQDITTFYFRMAEKGFTKINYSFIEHTIDSNYL